MSTSLVQVLDAPVPSELDPGLPRETLLLLYRGMVLVRALDERGMNLQRQGRISFYVPSTGEEAWQVGSAAAIEPEDWIFPTYRSQGACLGHGLPLQTLVHQVYGNASDETRGRQMPCHYCSGAAHIVSVSSPIATQLPQAVGTAYAMRYRKARSVVAAYFGDGGTSEGDFHCAMNFAGVFKVPVVFFCANNQWAITVPLTQQTASETIASKAKAYGFEGVRVDGNDVLAVYRTMRDAVDKARAGGGPTLVEAVTYRMGPHSTSDDPRRYRDDGALEAWRAKDPIARFRAYLEKRGMFDEAWGKACEEGARSEVQAAVLKAEAAGPPPLATLAGDVYERPLWNQEEALATLIPSPPHSGGEGRG